MTLIFCTLVCVCACVRACACLSGWHQDHTGGGLDTGVVAVLFGSVQSSPHKLCLTHTLLSSNSIAAVLETLSKVSVDASNALMRGLGKASQQGSSHQSNAGTNSTKKSVDASDVCVWWHVLRGRWWGDDTFSWVFSSDCFRDETVSAAILPPFFFFLANNYNLKPQLWTERGNNATEFSFFLLNGKYIQNVCSL